MPLLDAKCPNCGQVLQVDNSKEAAICEYCGSAFIVEKAINNYNITNDYHIGEGATVNIHSTDSLEKLLQNGETALHIKNYSLALGTYTKCTKSYPEAYQGWWGYIRAYTQDFTALTDIDTDKINSCYSYITQLCTDRSELAKMEDAYKGYLYLLAQREAPDLKTSISTSVQSIGDTFYITMDQSAARKQLDEATKEKRRKIIFLTIALVALAIYIFMLLMLIFTRAKVSDFISIGIGWGLITYVISYPAAKKMRKYPRFYELNGRISEANQIENECYEKKADAEESAQQLAQLEPLSEETFSRFLYIEYCNKYQLDPGFMIPEYNLIKQLLDSYDISYLKG